MTQTGKHTLFCTVSNFIIACAHIIMLLWPTSKGRKKSSISSFLKKKILLLYLLPFKIQAPG